MSSDAPIRILSCAVPAPKEAVQPPVVQTQPLLSPPEIERICKAFIRLLEAPLIQQQGVQDNDKY
jgi:hypothetical protein